MAGTRSAKGIPSCIERATNNRFRSTGQPWIKSGHKRWGPLNSDRPGLFAKPQPRQARQYLGAEIGELVEVVDE